MLGNRNIFPISPMEAHPAEVGYFCSLVFDPFFSENIPFCEYFFEFWILFYISTSFFG